MTPRVLAATAALLLAMFPAVEASTTTPSGEAAARKASVHKSDGTAKCVKKHKKAKRLGKWNGNPRKHCAKHQKPTPTPDPTANPTPSPTPTTQPQPHIQPYTCPAPAAAPDTPRPAPDANGLVVTTVATGLDRPWDVRALPGGCLLVPERDQLTLNIVSNGVATPVAMSTADKAGLWSGFETGLMGLELDADYATNGRFYLCHGYDGGSVVRNEDDPIDIRVTAWTLTAEGATKVQDLVTGMPVDQGARAGRHGGCELLLLEDGSLLIGTGDNAHVANPADMTSLGGKTLRVDPRTGEAPSDNPFVNTPGVDPRIYTWRHRNVQGLAQRADGSLWSIEQGPNVDDEVNVLQPGGDYGWNPGSPYENGSLMTDHSFDGDQIDAAWSSGNPTIATSGGTFAPEGFGRWGGRLLVAALKFTSTTGVQYGQHLRAIEFDASGNLVDDDIILTGHGRLRTAVVGPDDSIYVTTDTPFFESQTSDSDELLQIWAE